MSERFKIKWLINTYSAATAEKIKKVEEILYLTLPEVYKNFLYLTNGAEGNFVSLYDTESLIEMNQAYEVQEYAPGYVSIGNNNGGYHLLMKAETNATKFQLVSDGYGVPSPEDCTDDFLDWLHSKDGNPHRNDL